MFYRGYVFYLTILFLSILYICLSSIFWGRNIFNDLIAIGGIIIKVCQKCIAIKTSIINKKIGTVYSSANMPRKRGKSTYFKTHEKCSDNNRGIKMKKVLILVIMLLMGCGGKRLIGDVRGEWEIDRVKYIEDRTVGLVAIREDGQISVYCSGVLIGSEILSAGHCIEGVEESVIGDGEVYYVRRRDVIGVGLNPVGLHRGKILKVDMEKDLMLVGIEENFIVGGVSIGKVSIGDNVRMMGHLHGLYYTYMEGMVGGVWEDLPNKYRIEPIKGGKIEVIGNIGQGMSRGRIMEWEGRVSRNS